MGKTKRDITSTAEASFHRHYSNIWGQNRWQNSLYPALEERTKHVALVNKFSSFDPHDFFNGEEWDSIVLPTNGLADAEKWSKLTCFACTPKKDSNAEDISTSETLLQPRSTSATGSSLMSHWNLDAASVLAVSLLNVNPGDSVLDLCAAPGGKSIAIAQLLWPQLHRKNRQDVPLNSSTPGILRSNEFDSTRYRRLDENLRAYLPAYLFDTKRLETSHIDGADPLASRKLSVGSEGYDKVLVDAPCSSERHIIHAHRLANAADRGAPEMANWRPGSSKRLAKMQIDLLMTGLKSAKVGGVVLYATCSIEMSENDGVVEKVLSQIEKDVKKGAKWSVKVGFDDDGGYEDLETELERRWAERTKHGWIVLPDHPAKGGWGPLFFTKFTKIEAHG